jgi:putative nucleotidyltransferase with HDIG domain
MDFKTSSVGSGRMVQTVRRMHIPVELVEIGMRIIDLDRPWTETPFLFQGFRIETFEQIEELRQYCEEVDVEVGGEEWIPPPERAVSSGPRRARDAYEIHAPAPTRNDYAAAKDVVTTAQALTGDMIDAVRLGRGLDVKEVKSTVAAAVKLVLDSPDALFWMQKLREKSAYTAEHCVNVGLLAITFGRHLGHSIDDLNLLGVAGMLHDVGKALTPLDVLEKDGALSPEEFEVMREHTTQGRNILMGRKDVTYGAVDVAYGHHEALDGTGYPRKVDGSSLSRMTRIVTICDVFDAITSDRCYRGAQSSSKALEILNRGAGRKFDEQLVAEFVKCIGLYPTGAIVELRNGCLGIVVGTNYRNRRMPRILIVRDEEGKPCEERIVDLQRMAGKPDEEGWLIRTVAANGRSGVRVEEYVRRGLKI